MPTSNDSNSSGLKRPDLGRRALSSHAVVSRTPSDHSDSQSTNSNTSHAHKQHHAHHHHHRPHRPHVVHGAAHHRSHARNPSFGKNLNKLNRLTSGQHLVTEGTRRHHQRKKSAPPTPTALSDDDNHVRWDSAAINEDEPVGSVNQDDRAAAMRRNNSSPALRRDHSGILGKKAVDADRPHTSAGKKKKTVGFELAAEDNDEWEDTTQSPESTRRSSLAQGMAGADSTVLVDPLTFVKRSFPQAPRASSLPEPSRSFPREGHKPDDEEEEQEQLEEPTRETEQGRIATRLLSPTQSAKAPPAMSSISATAKPNVSDTVPRNASMTSLAASRDAARRTPSSTSTLANTPASQTQGTSSSMEGGVSRFIVNKSAHASPKTDLDPTTSSSFLPHYHPHTPPSPNTQGSKTARASPPARPAGTEPPSRTQQKLWLQRTATMNNSPPDSHPLSAGVSPSAMDLTYMAGGHGRSGHAYDTGRGLIMNGGARSGGGHDSEAKHIRKAYEKTAMELAVVRRFQAPTGDSFRRLSSIINDTKATSPPSNQGRPSGLGKPVKSAPSLTLLRDGKQSTRAPGDTSPEPRQLMSRRTSNTRPSAPQSLVNSPDDLHSPTDLPHRPKTQHPSHRILSTSDEATPGLAAEEEPEEPDTDFNENDLMIRRMWESREVATSG